MEDKLIFEVSKIEDDYTMRVGENVTGDEIFQGMAVLVKELGNRQRKIDPKCSDKTIIRGVELWLRYLENDQ